MTSDLELLQNYARNNSEESFAALVKRHLNLVYSAALRQVRSPQLAEEVAQAVFMDLSQSARKLRPDTILTAWLYQVTRRTAIDVVRRESRRQQREIIATEMNAMNATTSDWAHIEPLLDEAMQALDDTDRAAVLLRYFENKPLREVGARLGTSDDAAQKRVSRAVERLREFFTKRGITAGAAGLAAVISANAVQPAPASLAAAISSAATAAGTAFAGTAASTATKAIAMTTLQKTLIATIVAASVLTPILFHQRSVSRRRAAEEASGREAGHLADQQAEHDRLAALAAQTADNQSQSNDLARLRTKADTLRTQTNALPALRAQNRRLRAAADAPDVEPSESETQQITARSVEGKNWMIASFLYSRRNQGRLPAAMNQAAPFFPDKKNPPEKSADDPFEIVYQGSLNTITNPQDVIVLRQKTEPLPYGNRWAKVYVYGDGHSESHVQAGNDFTAWEREHIPSSPTSRP